MGCPQLMVSQSWCTLTTAQKKLLPWFDGMLEADEEYFKAYGEPLFSSHMLDLSEEPHDVNVDTCEKYFKRMAPMNLILEMEIGITGGVEDGVDNSGVSADKLYSTPADVWMVYEKLRPVSEKFTIAAAFGNVQGQIGNPEGSEKPNKNYYDPRKWLREAEGT